MYLCVLHRTATADVSTSCESASFNASAVLCCAVPRRAVLCRGAAQGDLLTWLLSGALAQDTNHSRLVLARARARDELLVATMELRERAMALHLHIPHKFTLNANRPCFDARTIWAAIITKVEEVARAAVAWVSPDA